MDCERAEEETQALLDAFEFRKMQRRVQMKSKRNPNEIRRGPASLPGKRQRLQVQGRCLVQRVARQTRHMGLDRGGPTVNYQWLRKMRDGMPALGGICWPEAEPRGWLSDSLGAGRRLEILTPIRQPVGSLGAAKTGRTPDYLAHYAECSKKETHEPPYAPSFLFDQTLSRLLG